MKLPPWFRILAAAIVLIGIGAPGPRSGWAQEETGDLIVMFRGETPSARRAEAVHRAGAQLRFNYETVSAAAVTVPSATVHRLLAGHPDVIAIVPDRPVSAHAKPGGSGGSTGQVVPAGVQRIGAVPGVLPWTGAGIGVAVVDTGIDFNHADLGPLGAACFSAFGACQDDNGHGTHVTGIIAARNNTIDVVGVAPAAVAYAVKVLNAQGSGQDSTIMAGLDWIAQNADLVSPPIRVVNMSLGRPGTPDDNPALRGAVQAARSKGISIVVSAGNDSSSDVSRQVPADYPEVIAVASTTALGGSNNRCGFFGGTIAGDTASSFTTDGAFNRRRGSASRCPRRARSGRTSAAAASSSRWGSSRRGSEGERCGSRARACPPPT